MLASIINRVPKRILSAGAALLALCIFMGALSGCGSGGGTSFAPVLVTGKVLLVETGQPPNPAATVNIGGPNSLTTATGDFSLMAASNATSVIVTATGSMTRTLPVSLVANVTNNLGTIYLSNTGYTATVTGRVVTTLSGVSQAVGNATVTISGSQVKTGTDGKFTITNLPVGLGNTAGVVGKVTASGFEDKPITDLNLGAPLTAGNNNIADLVIATPIGTTPPPPYTIKGVVQVAGKPVSGALVAIATGGSTLGTTTTDSTGTYFFWVVPASYTLTATNPSAGAMQTVSAQLISLDTPVTAPTINF